MLYYSTLLSLYLSDDGPALTYILLISHLDYLTITQDGKVRGVDSAVEYSEFL